MVAGKHQKGAKATMENPECLDKILRRDIEIGSRDIDCARLGTEGAQQSPRTVKRLTAVSNQLQKIAMENHRNHSVLQRAQSQGHNSQRNKKIHRNWTDDRENQSASPKGILHVHPEASCPEKQGSKPKKHVRISELRRGSLTGSLPDLNKASAEDVKDTEALFVGVEREPLPEGSEAFQAVMKALEEAHPEEDHPKRKERPRMLAFSLKELRERANGNSDMLIHKFRSRAAEVICMNRFFTTHPKYMNRIRLDSSGSESHSPTTPPAFSPMLHKGEINVSKSSDLIRGYRSMPSTPRASELPRFNFAQVTTTKKSSISPPLTSTSSSPSGCASPMSSPQTTADRLALRRVHSLGPGATASPQTLKRRAQTRGKKLVVARTRSNDA